MSIGQLGSSQSLDFFLDFADGTSNVNHESEYGLSGLAEDAHGLRVPEHNLYV